MFDQPALAACASDEVIRNWADAAAQDAIALSGATAACIVVAARDRVIAQAASGTCFEGGPRADAHGTRFAVGSLSKLFTATAICSTLHTRGVALDTPVAALLPPGLLNKISAAIKVEHLLRHRGGLAGTPGALQARLGQTTTMAPNAMRRWLVQETPPGAVTAYSNIGYGLLGVALAHVTGASFEQSMHDAVFAPLGMQRATFAADEPPEADEALGHVLHTSGAPRRVAPARLMQVVEAAGGARVSGDDIARFMRLYLGGGVDQNQALPPDFRAQMLSAERLHPCAPGVALGFIESNYAHARAIGHGGLVDGFTARLALFPSAGLGVFVVLNMGPDLREGALGAAWRRTHRSELARQRARSDVDRQLIARFARAFVPVERQSADVSVGRADGGISGVYLPTRSPGARSAWQRTVLRRAARLRVTGDSRHLRIAKRSYTRTLPGAYAAQDDAGGAWFSEDGRFALIGNSGVNVYQRQGTR